MKKALKITIAVTIILFLTFAGIMVKMIKENGECIDDPFGYSAKRLEESGGDYYCSCQALTTELLDFSFDKNGIKIIKPLEYEAVGLEINLTELEGGG